MKKLLLRLRLRGENFTITRKTSLSMKKGQLEENFSGDFKVVGKCSA